MQPLAAIRGQRGCAAAADVAAGRSGRAFGQPGENWNTWLQLLGCPERASATIVRFYTFSAAVAAAVAGAGIALGRSPLIDYDLTSGRLIRPFGERSMPGSWDFVIRSRPGAGATRTSISCAACCLNRQPRLTRCTPTAEHSRHEGESMRTLKFAFIGAALLATAGAAHASGTLRIGMQDDPDALDPARGGTFAGRIVFPACATSWSI